MLPEITVFGPGSPGFADWCAIYTAGRAADSGSTITAEAYAAWLAGTTPDPGIVRFAATHRGHIIGVAECRITDPGQTFARVYVTPPARRLGAGRGLAGAVTRWATDNGQATVTATAIVAGPGQEFAAALGARTLLRLVVVELTLATAGISVHMPPGVTVRHWRDGVPAALMDDYAAVKSAIADAPDADLQLDPAPWTADRVREAETAIAENGHELWVSVALDRAGSIVGYTEVEVPAGGGASQHGTAVVPRWRGQGVATWLKQDLANRLRTERPDVDRITSTINAVNAPMLAVCAALGYRTTFGRLLVRLDLPAGATRR